MSGSCQNLNAFFDPWHILDAGVKLEIDASSHTRSALHQAQTIRLRSSYEKKDFSRYLEFRLSNLKFHVCFRIVLDRQCGFRGCFETLGSGSLPSGLESLCVGLGMYRAYAMAW